MNRRAFLAAVAAVPAGFKFLSAVPASTVGISRRFIAAYQPEPATGLLPGGTLRPLMMFHPDAFSITMGPLVYAPHRQGTFVAVGGNGYFIGDDGVARNIDRLPRLRLDPARLPV